jgi:hypothetical protein
MQSNFSRRAFLATLGMLTVPLVAFAQDKKKKDDGKSKDEKKDDAQKKADEKKDDAKDAAEDRDKAVDGPGTDHSQDRRQDRRRDAVK